MCRLLLYMGPEIPISTLVTDPDHSIVRQSYNAKERIEPLNGDGFGIAWYARDMDGRPAIFKDITPAWNNTNLHNISRVTRSDCILAHVRAATSGLPVIQLNCHPFQQDELVFMHNGSIGGFRQSRRIIQARFSEKSYHSVLGSTDSEYLFGLMADKYRHYSPAQPTLEAMKSAMQETIIEVEEIRKQSDIEEPSILNMVLTNGRQSVVSRYASDNYQLSSLYINLGKRYVCEDGICTLYDLESTEGSVLVASEPLSQDSSWETVSPNHILTINEERQVSQYLIGN